MILQGISRAHVYLSIAAMGWIDTKYKEIHKSKNNNYLKVFKSFLTQIGIAACIRDTALYNPPTLLLTDFILRRGDSDSRMNAGAELTQVIA